MDVISILDKPFGVNPKFWNGYYRYGNDLNFCMTISIFIALTFCAEGDVVHYYEQLATQFLDQFGDAQVNQDFLEYFENTWVGRQEIHCLG